MKYRIFASAKAGQYTRHGSSGLAILAGQPGTARRLARAATGFALILILALVTIAMTGCARPAPKQELGIKGGDAVVYDCGDGTQITARYYALSDDSLHFVKLVLPDGSQSTLPNLGSASGARYSDDFTFVWWTKGATAFLQKRDDAGEWKTIYQECRERPSASK